MVFTIDKYVTVTNILLPLEMQFNREKYKQ